MPKTIRNVYDTAVSFEKLLDAHKKARRGKREKQEVIIFELNLENEILRMENELKNGTYKHGKYREFKIYEPKCKSQYKIDKKIQYKIDRILSVLF